MRIGIDSLPILANIFQRTGISRYNVTLFKHLLEIDKKNSYCFFNRMFHRNARKARSHMYNLNFSNFHERNIYLPDRLLNFLWSRNSRAIAELFFYQGIDAFISTSYFTPLLKKTKVISILYDLTAIKSPFFDKSYSSKVIRQIGTTIKRSVFLFTISENSKKDFIEYFNLKPEKIEVIYPAAESYFRPLTKEEITPVLDKFGLNSKYILYVGIRGKHKNVVTLLKAFVKLKRKYKIPHKLVFSGRQDYSNNQIEKEMEDIISHNQMEKEVIFTGYVKEDDLPFIYNGADLCVFIPLYEGFGLPLLEALACGVPTIASGVASLPEVVGKGAILINPLNEEEIEQSIMKVIENQNLKVALKKNGLLEAAKFSWEKSAEKFLGILNRLS